MSTRPAKTWITTRLEEGWTIFEEQSHDAPPRFLLKVRIPPNPTREELARFGEHLIALAKRDAEPPS